MKIPQLRFPEFEGEWKEEKIGEIYSFKVTNSFSRDNLNYEEGTVKNIHYGDIHTKFQTLFNIENEKVPFINSDISIDRISEENYCREGDLILADASEDLNDVGKSIEIVNLNNEKLLSGLHTILARPNLEKFAIGFGGFLFKSKNVRTKIQKEAQGSKVLSISATRLTNSVIAYPTKDEQSKIVELLTAIDEKIQALKKKKSLLENYKKGVMQKLFSQTLRFKDENGEEFPEWEVKKLGEVCEYKNGGAFENQLSENGKYFLISLNSLDINGNLKQEHKRLDFSDNSLQKGDLVMVLSDVAHGNFLGLTDIIPNDNFVLNQRMGALKPKLVINKYYLKTFININQKYFKLKGQGSSQQNLSKGDIEMFEIKIPFLEEQNKIANFLADIDTKINMLIFEIKNDEIWKKGLLQKIFC